MNICNSNHEEICYESRNCPLCAEIDERKDVERDLNTQIKDLENQIQDLNSQISSQ